MEQVEQHRFWMVWNEGNRGPVFQHPTQTQALEEAERLAKLAPGEVFFVLKTTAAVIAQEPSVQRVTLTADPIPF